MVSYSCYSDTANNDEAVDLSYAKSSESAEKTKLSSSNDISNVMNCSSSVVDSFESTTPKSKNSFDAISPIVPAMKIVPSPISPDRILPHMFAPSFLKQEQNALPIVEAEQTISRKKNSYKDAPKLISCPVPGCKQKFPWNSSLKRHILTHTRE
ncbi:Ras responsive element binding protein 1 [Cichlidogyrus casuarinus]|uniref:Ras responsive element binding protein 1 n=1 Tax=Cichlidogyrus casuarinus TaxID=1844966 RepID=A0ABD2Q054_9PLAT